MYFSEILLCTNCTAELEQSAPRRQSQQKQWADNVFVRIIGCICSNYTNTFVRNTIAVHQPYYREETIRLKETIAAEAIGRDRMRQYIHPFAIPIDNFFWHPIFHIKLLILWIQNVKKDWKTDLEYGNLLQNCNHFSSILRANLFGASCTYSCT